MKHPKHKNSPVAKSKNAAKTAALMGVLVAVAFVLSYVEMVLHFSVGIPGVKLGLCHIVTLFALYRIDPKAAVFTCFVRIILNAWLFGNTMILAYSAAGGASQPCRDAPSVSSSALFSRWCQPRRRYFS